MTRKRTLEQLNALIALTDRDPETTGVKVEHIDETAMDTMKAGTRCECRDAACCGDGNGHGRVEHSCADGGCDCHADSVRLVYFMDPKGERRPDGSVRLGTHKHLCAACAAHAEGGAK